MYSFFGSGLVPSYSAAKGAIVQLTKAMAVELAPHNIQVNAIAPRWIETDMTAPVRTMPLNDEILARTPAGRWGRPEKVAGTGSVHGLAGFGLRHRYYDSGRWRLCDPKIFRT